MNTENLHLCLIGDISRLGVKLVMKNDWILIFYETGKLLFHKTAEPLCENISPNYYWKQIDLIMSGGNAYKRFLLIDVKHEFSENAIRIYDAITNKQKLLSKNAKTLIDL